MSPAPAPDNDYNQALAEGWLPIREVSRRTGVNPVTLRAWERRYGLVVPHRTPKGHRLYSAEHLARIESVLTWLNRGVPVSQVKVLLESPAQRLRQRSENEWQPLCQQLLEAVAELAERKLDDKLNQAMALYPPSTLCQQLLMPLLRELDLRWQGQPGAAAQRAFFLSWLRSKLGARIYHNNRQLSGKPVLLINQSDLPMEPALWITAWLISSADCPVEVFDVSLPPGELASAAALLGARTTVLYSSRPLHLERLATQVMDAGLVLLAGPCVEIHRSELAMHPTLSSLPLASTPLDACQQLQMANVL
ncbi:MULTISPECIES: MerR family transcriptional regulator [unclassified Pseudomonas]|uniref:MerR family transcriptional regulator n=1 Tax=unclassified Pseudomonas TaxID=196821 RepID=UPI000BD01CF3|nr:MULTISPECIES: MerR family transcriptional regulator [unclassified Pseudomonas]PVZ15947.1 DNA-binding transcriptional MerR regulator [Pseudomonas sp. URIL14HWK12:I12]PVZ26197.1 DNA-binding transcriptional MerR regulator [Pseudomonas sp. URIL14HWK12:I10]PVZ36279.1 DNA-binding transcriptional MerR regulator [Pseudomonas sp. URIL14HWK12:I11]SNZ18318.1 transcriptional regulator, MerR family [Pseudomonas sp. URIL14HWK12:I9]